MPRDAFTIVELVVVVLVLGILAGIDVPRLIDQQQEAAGQATVTQVLQIFKAAELHYAEHNEWPANTPVGVLPPEFEGVLPARVFTEPSPLGRSFDWNGAGTGMPSYGVSVPPGMSTSVMNAIDARHDDGNLRTGWITATPSRALNFELAPKP